MRLLFNVLILLPFFMFATSSLAASITEIDECTVMLRNFKAEPNKVRTESELKKLKNCLDILKEAEREPEATIFRKHTSDQ